jgi:glycosyltransferase involved in cell wall biosynthesis
MYQTVLYGTFLLMFFIQLYYYLNVFRRATRHTIRLADNAEQPPVSVVICATNEHDNLLHNLPVILEQKYPRFDVIVVNDCSTDKTEELLSSLKLKYDNLYYSNVETNEKFKHDRKLAITLGIKASQYDHIIFTGADCMPPNNQWLASMQAGFASDPAFLVGYCNYTALSRTKRCDFIYTALFALNAVHKGFPFYINFKNAGISKKMFLDNKGFYNLTRFPNSEATLFVCRNANARNAVVNLLPDSITQSSQRLSTKQWWKERGTLSSLFSLGKRGQGVRHLELYSRLFYYFTEITLLCLAFNHYFESMMLVGLVVIPAFVRLCLQISILGRIKKVWHEKGIAFALFLYDRWSLILAFFIALSRPNLYKIKNINK